MTKFLIFLFALVVMVNSITYMDVLREEWESFKIQYEKRYADPLEERMRLKIFMENSRKIARHNKLYAQGLSPFKMAMNKFGDKLHQEFINTVNGFNRTLKATKYTDRITAFTFMAPANVEVPKDVDWRKDGAVTPVKDQGECGSCYTFGATGALEGQIFKKTKKLVSFSEQNLVDCSSELGNQGCDGGTVEICFLYTNINKGLDTEKSYPYEGAADECRYEEDHSGGKDRGYIQLKGEDEEELKVAVATVGPIAVAIDANHESFQFYSQGVYYEPECSSQELSHAVLAVGYGSDKHDGDYWLIKNSWGDSWGEKGYIRMARNKENNCGIATECSYPII